MPPAWCARPSELRTAAIVAAWLAVAPQSVHHFALPLCGRTGKRAAMKTSAITLYSHWRTLSVGMEVPGLLRRAPAGADASAGRQPQEAFVEVMLGCRQSGDVTRVSITTNVWRERPLAVFGRVTCRHSADQRA